MEDKVFFTMVFQPIRYEIIRKLSPGTLSMSEIAKKTGFKKPILSYHLDKLEQSGIVLSRHEIQNKVAIRNISLSKVFYDKLAMIKKLVVELGT